MVLLLYMSTLLDQNNGPDGVLALFAPRACALQLVGEVLRILAARKIECPLILDGCFNIFDTILPMPCLFRMNHEELTMLHQELCMSLWMQCSNRTKFLSFEGLCLMLYHFAFPCPWMGLVQFFCHDETAP